MRHVSSKRTLIKGIILSVAVNGFFLYSQYHEHGIISRDVWTRFAISLSVSLVVIAGLSLLLVRLGAPAAPSASNAPTANGRRLTRDGSPYRRSK